MKLRIVLLGVAVIGAVSAGVYLRSTRVTVHPLEVRQTPASLAASSDLVLVGTLQNPVAKTIADPSAGTLVVTEWTVEPREVWKGQAPTPLIVTQTGGTRNGVTVSDPDSPVFDRGYTGLLYLTYIPETSRWVFTSALQGVFTLRGNRYENRASVSYTAPELRGAVNASSATNR